MCFYCVNTKEFAGSFCDKIIILLAIKSPWGALSTNNFSDFKEYEVKHLWYLCQLATLVFHRGEVRGGSTADTAAKANWKQKSGLVRRAENVEHYF